jgi:DNA invertase Pin-like site-specific DNA recombinase
MKAKTQTKAVPVAILVRVSTMRQETNRQVSELQAYARQKGFRVVEVCRETVSGRANKDERMGLNRAESLAKEGKIKKVLVHEVSRLARRNSVAHDFVETLEGCGVSLYWHAQGIETLLPSGKRNPAAGIMLALLSEMARAEAETLRERIKSGLAQARRDGKRLGRPKESNMFLEEFLRKHADVVRQLREGQSIRNAAKITDKGVSTVQRVAMELKACMNRKEFLRVHADVVRQLRGGQSIQDAAKITGKGVSTVQRAAMELKACMNQKEFLRVHADVVRQLRGGQSIRNAAKITGKGESTVQRVKRELKKAGEIEVGGDAVTRQSGPSHGRACRHTAEHAVER